MSLENEPPTVEEQASEEVSVLEQPAEATLSPESNIEQTPAEKGRDFIDYIISKTKEDGSDKILLPMFAISGGLLLSSGGAANMDLMYGTHVAGLWFGLGVAGLITSTALGLMVEKRKGDAYREGHNG